MAACLRLFVCAVSIMIPRESFGQTQNLSFMLMTSFGEFGLNSSGIVPAVNIALEDINGSPTLLPGYNLTYDEIRDSQCNQVRALDEFFDGIQTDPVEIAVIGCGCSVATFLVAEISHRWNIPQLSYASGLPPLSDRRDFPGFFQNVPPYEGVTYSLHSIMNYFNWQRIAVLTQDEIPFTRAELSYRIKLESDNITVVSQLLETTSSPISGSSDIFFEDDDYRIFFLNCYSQLARRIICEAVRRGLVYPRYTWITYDWYPYQWWERSMEVLSCTNEEIEQFLDRVISIRQNPLPEQGNITTDAAITPLEFENEYTTRANAEGYNITEAGYTAHDAVWILAVALNNTMTMVLNENITNTGCNNLPGSLVNLSDFDHTNMLMGCLIQWNFQNTNFSGVSGNVVYDVNRTRVYDRILLRQYVLNEQGDIERQTFAVVDKAEDNAEIIFLPGFDNNTIYPDGVPLDGSVLNITRTFELELVVVFDVLATLGIGFVVVCCAFNFFFREKKIVKISSPSINYFILVGALLMYSSIYFYLIPSFNRVIVLTGCVLQIWLFTIGYSLAFGAVLAKMWRVYEIFNNPKPKKRVWKDWHLAAITLTITGISLILLILEASIPLLRGLVTLEKDGELSNRRTEGLGIREEFYVLVCYESASPSFFWRIFIFSYLAVLQLVGIILSFQTRKVKYTGLRDSKFIAIIIYISSIVTVVLALVTFALRTFINIGTGIFISGYFLLTTTFLCFIFIPKMVLLYKDPTGNVVTENTLNHSVTASVRDTAIKLNFHSQLPNSGSVTDSQVINEARI